MNCLYNNDSNCSTAMAIGPGGANLCENHWGQIKPRTEDFKLYIHPEVAQSYGISDGDKV